MYTELRKAASQSHGMPIAVRHLESLIRMSEAHAKMHLREYVSDEDINAAIRYVRAVPAYRCTAGCRP